MKVYQSINRVQADLAKEGISKDRKNEQQGYRFRGIDDVFNALAPLLSKHGLCVLPRCTSREVVERTTSKGTALFYVTVCAEFDFVCAEDGSRHTVGPMYGEAMDSGDKATNKAMSAAYKYACLQAFSIPTEGDNDADASSHEVKPSVGRQAAAELDQAIVSALESANTIADLSAAWNAIPVANRRHYSQIKDQSKLAITERQQNENAEKSRY